MGAVMLRKTSAAAIASMTKTTTSHVRRRRRGAPATGAAARLILSRDMSESAMVCSAGARREPGQRVELSDLILSGDCSDRCATYDQTGVRLDRSAAARLAIERRRAHGTRLRARVLPGKAHAARIGGKPA